MGFAMGTIRYILFFFNFLLAIAGIGILALGVVTAHSNGDSLNQVIHGQLSTPAIIFAIVGGCVFLFAFFGCCGALRESHCMICTYAVLLLTLILMQVGVAVLAYTYRGETQDFATNAMNSTFYNYNNSSDPESAKLVDGIQHELGCCGTVDNKTPWQDLHIQPPLSCYSNHTDSSGNSKPAIYSDGCITKVVSTIKEALGVLGQIAIIVGAVEVVGLVFALCLANSIRRSELRGYA